MSRFILDQKQGAILEGPRGGSRADTQKREKKENSKFSRLRDQKKKKKKRSGGNQRRAEPKVQLEGSVPFGASVLGGRPGPSKRKRVGGLRGGFVTTKRCSWT